MRHLAVLATLLALVVLTGRAEAEETTRRGDIIFRAPPATARHRAAQQWRIPFPAPTFPGPPSTPVPSHAAGIGETGGGKGCVATCMGATGGLPCAMVGALCTQASTITIGGTAIPCILVLGAVCFASIGASSYCADLCARQEKR